jgi:hypothetical protein
MCCVSVHACVCVQSSELSAFTATLLTFKRPRRFGLCLSVCVCGRVLLRWNGRAGAVGMCVMHVHNCNGDWNGSYGHGYCL